MKLKKLFQWIRILLFTVVLVGGCVLGFILSLRPSVSESEGRELTKFPTFSVESFLSGEYTSQISLWYADTFPFRETLLDMSGDFKGLYGVGDMEFEGYEGEVDSIGSDTDFVWDEEPPADEPPESEAPSEQETHPEDTPPPEDTEEETGPYSEVINGYYIEGDTCYELYYYNANLVDRYCRVVVKAALELDGVATVHRSSL